MFRLNFEIKRKFILNQRVEILPLKIYLCLYQVSNTFEFSFQMTGKLFLLSWPNSICCIHCSWTPWRGFHSSFNFSQLHDHIQKWRRKWEQISFVYLRKINVALYLSQLILGTIYVFHLCLRMRSHKLSKILLAEYWWSKLKHESSYKLFLPVAGLFIPFCFRTKWEQANDCSPASSRAGHEWGWGSCNRCSYWLAVKLLCLYLFIWKM